MGNIEIKRCFKCGCFKELSEFYTHPQMADGHLNKCKTCSRMDVQANRRLRVDYYRLYDRMRGNRQTAEYRIAWRRDNPAKTIAHNKINNGLRDGKLERPTSCSVCGRDGVALHGHHVDYTRPLDVIWCCLACHCSLHGG